jgi:hypothetical protein
VHLRRAAQAVDAACSDGDGAAFAAATTAAYRRQLEHKLRAVDGRLDASTLRAMARHTHAAWLALPLLAAHVDGARAAIAVTRPGGDGAQVLRFVWDGRRFRLDDSRQAAPVHDAVDARRAVAAAAAAR